MNSQENKQLIMQGYQLFNDKNIAGLMEMFADDIEWVAESSEVLPFSGTYRGREEVAQFFQKLDNAQEPLRFEPQEFIAEGDKVVVLGQSTWRVKATGQTYDNPFAHVFTVKDGKTVRFQEYNDTAAAEAAYRPTAGATTRPETTLRH